MCINFYFFALLVSLPAWAEETDSYIDLLQRTMPAEKPGTLTLEEKRTKLINESNPKESAENYSELLKKTLPEKEKEETEGSYTEKIQIELKNKAKENDEESDQESAIAKVKNGGKSELTLKRPGKIHHAIGFRMGAFVSRNFSNGGGLGFSSLYSGPTIPEMGFTYEFQPFHSEWFGNIGFEAQAGMMMYRGAGQLQFNLVNPATQQSFGTDSKMLINFWAVPVTLGANYRFNLARYIRPYVFAGPTVVFYQEARGDSIPGNRGWSRALTTSLGTSFLLDFLSRSSSFNLYDDAGVKKFYLTAEFTRVSNLGSEVGFDANGLYFGFLFEL